MSKEQIDEIAKLICTYPQCIHYNIIGECANTECQTVDIAETLYNAGYRKQSEVVDEFAERLKEKMDDLARMEYNGVPYFLVSKAFIDKIAEEMKGGAG